MFPSVCVGLRVHRHKTSHASQKERQEEKGGQKEWEKVCEGRPSSTRAVKRTKQGVL